MTLICFASQKGSPGTTATSLAVAAALKVTNGRRKLLLEADSTGGTLAIRYRLPVEPGLLTLAAAVRSGTDADGLWRHAQELPGGLSVVVCPDGPEQVNAALSASGAQLGRFLSRLHDVDVICDVGRLAPDSPSLNFVAEASAVLMVARPTAEQLQPAARRMMMLRPHVSNLGWVLIGQKPYGPADVETTYKFPVVGVIADDPRSVASLENGVVTKRIRRHPFIRSSATLAQTLSEWLAPLAVPAETLLDEVTAQDPALHEPALQDPALRDPADRNESNPFDSSLDEAQAVDRDEVRPEVTDASPIEEPADEPTADAIVVSAVAVAASEVAVPQQSEPSVPAKPPESFRGGPRAPVSAPEAEQDGSQSQPVAPWPADSEQHAVSPDWLPPEPSAMAGAADAAPSANGSTPDVHTNGQLGFEVDENWAGDGLSVDDLEGWASDQFTVTADLSEVFIHPQSVPTPAAEQTVIVTPRKPQPAALQSSAPAPERRSAGAPSVAPAQLSQPAIPAPPMPPPQIASEAQPVIDPLAPADNSAPPSPFPHEEADADWMAR